MILSTIVDGRRDQRINLVGINQYRLLCVLLQKESLYLPVPGGGDFSGGVVCGVDEAEGGWSGVRDDTTGLPPA